MQLSLYFPCCLPRETVPSDKCERVIIIIIIKLPNCERVIFVRVVTVIRGVNDQAHATARKTTRLISI
jgi:hypothetical protein